MIVFFLCACENDEVVIDSAPKIANLVQSEHIMCAGGYDATIAFQLIDLDNETVGWSATLENAGDGSIEPNSGEALQSGSGVQIHFRSSESTHAKLTINAFDSSGDQATPVIVSIIVGYCSESK